MMILFIKVGFQGRREKKNEYLLWKNCDECTYKAELFCSGCQSGPGRVIRGDCKLARCCREKGHETCEVIALVVVLILVAGFISLFPRKVKFQETISACAYEGEAISAEFDVGFGNTGI